MRHGCFAVFAFQGMEIEDMALVAVENESRKEQHKRRGRNAVTTSPSPGRSRVTRVGMSAAEWGTSSQETLKDFAAISAGIACKAVWFSSCYVVHINNTDLLSLSFPFSTSFFPHEYKPQPLFVSPERLGDPFQQLFRCEVAQHSKVQL